MIRIAHRGNVAGPAPGMENKPEYLEAALRTGYDVETDVWKTDDGLYLGHDAPIYKTDRSFLRDSRVWTHCKNIAALMELLRYPDVNCFFQEADEAAITSRGYLWAHSKSPYWDKKTIVTCLGKEWTTSGIQPHGLCSDFASYYAAPCPRHSLFRVLIVDIDGVMTDGTKIYDKNGAVVGKSYCDLDFTAIKRFKAAGVSVCFLSGDQNVNSAMAATRKVPFFHSQPGIDKADMLPQIASKYGAIADETAYVGDDYYDISIMSLVGTSFCPQSSPAPVRRASRYVVPVDAGKGVLAGIYDMVEGDLPAVFPKDSPDVNP